MASTVSDVRVWFDDLMASAPGPHLLAREEYIRQNWDSLSVHLQQGETERIEYKLERIEHRQRHILFLLYQILQTMPEASKVAQIEAASQSLGESSAALNAATTKAAEDKPWIHN